MPSSGSPLVRELRKLTAAHSAYPGLTPSDPEELLGWYDRQQDPEGDAGDPRFLRRRTFLAGSLTGLAGVAGAGLLGSGTAAASREDANVVIVGAGLAGLTCAYRLNRLGIASTVYEARERLGGRCWTIRDVFENRQSAEHGGQYVDSRHRHMRSLAKELGIGLVDTFRQDIPSGSKDYLWLDGSLRRPNKVYAGFGAFIDGLQAEYRRVGPYFYDEAGPEAVAFDHLTVDDYLDQAVPGGRKSLFGLDGKDLSAINLFEFFVYPYPGADERYRIANGNDTVVHRLADALPGGTIHLERPLEAIWTGSDGRTGLRFRDGHEIAADMTVLALPFTALRDIDTSRLQMSPRRRQAVAKLAMGTNAKLQFQLDRSLASLDWSGSFTSDKPEFGTWDSTFGQTRPAPETPVITVYTGGAAGAGYNFRRAHGTPPHAVVDAQLNALARGVDGIDAAWNGRAYLDSWADDPWVRGSYAGFAPGQYTKWWGYLGKAEDRLLFAGEHTSTFSQGYLNGGVESGERAARQVQRRVSKH
jgi:monoamine oxidase